MTHVAVLVVMGTLAFGGTAYGQSAASIAQRTAGLERVEGYLPFYLDAARGRLLFELPRLHDEILYFVGIAKGVGSVELGVDRGSTDSAMVIRFERAGSRIHAVQENLQYRALNRSAALQEGLEQSFASSVLAALPIEAEEGGKVLVDATPLVLRDATGIEESIRQRTWGAFRLDPTRSAVYAARTKAFPRNTEVEVTLTFASDNPSRLLETAVPDPRALTVRIHHSFVQPPEPGYQPRRADPRIGVNALSFRDYSAPFSDDTNVRWVRRWRLDKKDPASAISEPTNPIVYYLDPGIPEPVRTAMRDGLLWWNRGFEAAGFRNALQVKDPPPDMDPMDIRYSYVLWVNRDERGFSNGGQFADPRTGEILVAKPRMDSARVRTISSYWQSYRPPTGDDGECGMFLAPIEALVGAAPFQAGPTARGEQAVVLTRQALLTAHEVGHTLGFAHNWNSSINDRASVMEYPTPRVKLTAAKAIDLSDAYQRSIGEYDTFMVRYAYTPFPPDDERAGLDAIVREMRAKGLLFTAPGDPRWNWYDDLSSPTEYLRETMKVRAVLLDRYGPDLLRPGEPLGELRDMRLWMAYLHHRWAIDSSMKYIGGQYQNIAVKGDTLPPTEIVPASLQREVLSLLMQAIEPVALALPERLLVALAPNPYGRDIEELPASTGAAFDHLGAARALAAMVLEQLLEPDRAARLVAFADRQAGALTLPDVLNAIVESTWGGAREDRGMTRSLGRVTERVAADAMMILGAHAQATPEVRAVVLDRLARLRADLGARHDADGVAEAHIRQVERDLTKYLENPSAFTPRSSWLSWGGRPRSRYPLPPGPPLGGPRP